MLRDLGPIKYFDAVECGVHSKQKLNLHPQLNLIQKRKKLFPHQGSSLKGYTVSRDFRGQQMIKMDRALVLDIPLDVYFL